MFNYLNELTRAVLFVLHYKVPNNARRLILGTIAVESNFGKYRKQINGNAIGICQIEKPTFEFLKEKYNSKYPFIIPIKFEDLEYNDFMAITYCRLKYLSVPKPLPDGNNLDELASYWKIYYNTYKGKGKIEDYIRKFKEYVII